MHGVNQFWISSILAVLLVWRMERGGEVEMYMYDLLSYIHLHTQLAITGICRTLKKREDRVWAVAEGDEHIPEWSDEEGGEEGEEKEEVRMCLF